MKKGAAILALPLALTFWACSEAPVSPDRDIAQSVVFKKAEGSGLVLNSLTGLTLPLIGQLGDVVVDQAVITNLKLVEDLAGQIVGIEAEGVLQLTGGVLGTDVVTEDFSTLLSITSSGPGQCQLISIDLGPIGIDALGLVTVDLPAASLTGRGSGALGSLLCNLGNLLSGLTGGIASGVQGLVNAINNRI